MSLYEGLNVDLGSQKQKEEKQGSWSDAGLKLLQSQIQLKKATQSQKDRQRTTPGPASVAPVVDLSSRSAGTKPTMKLQADPPSLLKPRKPLVLDGPPLSFIPVAAKEEKILIFGEIVVEDEYNPLIPNDYEEFVTKKEEEKKRQREEERRKGLEERDKRRKERLERDDEELEKDKEKRPVSGGAAIAPPPNLVEEDKKVFDEPTFVPDFGSGSKGLGVAARIMEKYGYKQGSGLGRQHQGISTALQVEKTSVRGGRIIYEKDVPKEEEPEPPPVVVVVETMEGDAPCAEPVPITEILKNPTKLVLLRNMVAPGDVDSELDPEVREEMAKYGEVTSCLIYELPPPTVEHEAVRIFVEFSKVDQAIKAVVDLNGRYFGGRNVRASFYDVEKYRNYQLTAD